MGKLEGKTAVVTGAGRGIGAAIVGALAEQGARLILAARTGGEIDSVAKAFPGARAIVCDVADPLAIENLRAVAGPVDILVNSAGISSSAPLKNLTVLDWEHQFRVNATGSMLCIQAFLPAMVAQSWGRIVNVASVAGLTGGKYIAAYAASKHALLGLTRSVAAEVARVGVTVNAVCPGYVDTPMTDASVQRIVAKTGQSEAEARQSLARVNPQGRLIEAEEVAALVAFLCLPEARGINGQSIVIDGGALL